MGTQRDLLAIQVIVATFAAAWRAHMHDADADVRTVLLTQARARALELLGAAERRMSYVAGSPLDRLIREARRQIEAATPPD